MSAVRPQVRDGSGLVRDAYPGDIMVLGESPTAGALTTIGAGTLTGALLATGIIIRSGPVGGYTDTTDTAANILTALAANSNADVVAGSSFRVLFINTVAQAMVLAAGTGVTLGTDGSGVTTIAASLWRDYLFTVLNASPPVALQCNTTNASKVVTFVLPSGMTAYPQGPAPNAINITPGMIVGGTGITAGTKVLSVTAGQGGITGVGLDANATATSAAGGVALTFNPNIKVDGLRSGTL